MKVAFIGHRDVENSREFSERVTEITEKLIREENADTFYFGSTSMFDNICYDVVTKLRNEYKHIRRVFVRAEYEYIDKMFTQYLHALFEDSFYPEQIYGAGLLSYVKRNEVVIDRCDVLVTYCDKSRVSCTEPKSSAKFAVEYARKKHKRIINLWES